MDDPFASDIKTNDDVVKSYTSSNHVVGDSKKKKKVHLNDVNVTVGNGSSSSSSSSEVAVLREKLAQKEQEILRKDARIVFLEENVLSVTANARFANWPLPFLKLCHHNIREEIEEPKLASMVRLAYGTWILEFIGFIWLLVCMVSSLTTGYLEWILSSKSSAVAYLFLGVIYFLSGVPLSFRYWYYKLYNCHRLTGFSTPGVKYWKWFFHMFCACVWSSLFASGIVPGTSGYYMASKMFTSPYDHRNILFGSFFLLSAILWTIISVLQWIILLRTSGGRQPDQSDVIKASAQGSQEVAPILANVVV